MTEQNITPQPSASLADGLSLYMAKRTPPVPGTRTPDTGPPVELSVTEKIRQIMNERGLRQDYVAKQGGMDPNYLTRLMNGHRGWTDDSIRKVAKGLGVPFYTLSPPPAGSITLDQVLEDRDKIAFFMNAPLSEDMITWAHQMLEIMRQGRETRRLDRASGNSEV